MPPLALLTAVPTDLTLLIFSFLSPHTLTTCSATSTTLRPLSLHDVLWQPLLLRHRSKAAYQPPTCPAAPSSVASSPSLPGRTRFSDSTCYAQYLRRSLDAARSFVTRAELLQGRWRFVFHHSIPFSLITSLAPTFDELHVHAHPFGSYPYILYDRERSHEASDVSESAPQSDLNGLPLPIMPSSVPAPLSAYERLGFLSPAMRAECERLWAQHDDSLHDPSRYAEPLAARSPVFARSALPFTVLHLIDLMMVRSLCFQHLPLFTTERVEGGQWRLNNQLGAFESLGEEVAAAAAETGDGAAEAAESGAEQEALAGEAAVNPMTDAAFFELHDWFDDVQEQDWFH